MNGSVSAAEANRRFSRLLSEVRRGKSYVVTSHGRPVARISPHGQTQDLTLAARKLLFERLRRQPAAKIARWTRNELYEDER
jgi:prevent-host-death family protein